MWPAASRRRGHLYVACCVSQESRSFINRHSEFPQNPIIAIYAIRSQISQKNNFLVSFVSI